MKRELRARGIDAEDAPEEEDSGSIAICSRCLDGTGMVFCPKENAEIQAVDWDRNASTAAFQDKFFHSYNKEQ